MSLDIATRLLLDSAVPVYSREAWCRGRGNLGTLVQAALGLEDTVQNMVTPGLAATLVRAIGQCVNVRELLLISLGLMV